MLCPICEAALEESKSLCSCGFDSSKNRIVETEAPKTFYRNLKTNSHWTEPIKFTKKLHKFQQSIKGKTSYGKRGGWGYRETAILLGLEPSVVSDNIKLADYLEEYPDLKTSRNRKQALDKIPNLKSGLISINFQFYNSEEQLHKYLENNWHETPFSTHWNMKESLSNAGSAGQIDLLAKHKIDNAWLIIELKRKEAPDKTVGQLLRYMGWFKNARADAEDDVRGVIISGYPPDHKLLHSISGTSGVELWTYCLSGDRPNFMDKDTTLRIMEFERRPIREQEEALKGIAPGTTKDSDTT